MFTLCRDRSSANVTDRSKKNWREEVNRESKIFNRKPSEKGEWKNENFSASWWDEKVRQPNRGTERCSLGLPLCDTVTS